MGKLTLAIGVIYILYYAGNIVYDLYFRKEKVIETDNTTDYEIGDVADQVEEHIQNVTIDDVEHIQMPKSFESEEEIISENQEQNLEELQKKYEDENHINEVEQPTQEVENPQEKIQEKKPSITDTPIKNIDLQNILSEIKTKVKMVANYDGQKVYSIG